MNKEELKKQITDRFIFALRQINNDKSQIDDLTLGETEIGKEIILSVKSVVLAIIAKSTAELISLETDILKSIDLLMEKQSDNQIK